LARPLKIPLITIRGFTGLLGKDMEKDDRERMKHDMERINTAAAHMQELLNDLLELSRIGRMVNPSEEVSLGEIAFGTVRLLSVQIKERGIAVEIAPDIPPPFSQTGNGLERSIRTSWKIPSNIWATRRSPVSR
jgi:signal transduction histidine kinase